MKLSFVQFPIPFLPIKEQVSVCSRRKTTQCCVETDVCPVTAWTVLTAPRLSRTLFLNSIKSVPEQH